jgi:hypothetical protein
LKIRKLAILCDSCRGEHDEDAEGGSLGDEYEVVGGDDGEEVRTVKRRIIRCLSEMESHAY